MDRLSCISPQAVGKLDDEHYKDLRQSGLSDRTIEESGIYSAASTKLNQLLGTIFWCRGMVFPYSPVTDWVTKTFVRVKLDVPGADGKRYRSPKGSSPELYFPPILEPVALGDPQQALIITEGEKKALKGCQEGLLCLALGGVWAWRMRQPNGDSVPLPSLDRVVWEDRTVHLCFDSDVVRNVDVARAEAEFAKELARRGAIVYAIRLPESGASGKVGLDDYLLAHSLEEFQDLKPIRLAPKVLGVGLGTFLGEAIPKPAPLIEGLLSSEGSGWIAGEEKLGKTFYALEEALCLALGLSVCGRFAVPMQQRVLFLEEEDAPGRVRTRIEGLLRGHGVNPDDSAVRDTLSQWFQVGVWKGITFDDDDRVRELERTIKEFRPAVVYVDALRKLTTKDLNKADEASKILQRLDAWRHDYGCLFRIVHHYRKGQGGYRTGRGSQEISGSYVLGAWPEMSLFFSPIGKQSGCAKAVVQTKDGVPPDPFKITIHTEQAGGFEVIRLTAEEMTRGDEVTDTLKDQIMELLATCEQTHGKAGASGVTITTLMKSLKKKAEKPVREALKVLEADGRVKKNGSTAKGAHLWVACG